ncbi:transposase [Halovulum sp. GXIMD14793]
MEERRLNTSPTHARLLAGPQLAEYIDLYGCGGPLDWQTVTRAAHGCAISTWATLSCISWSHVLSSTRTGHSTPRPQGRSASSIHSVTIGIPAKAGSVQKSQNGNAHDTPEGRALLTDWEAPIKGVPLLMDRAYEGDETRQLVLDLGMVPVVPPKANRRVKWGYDRTLYKRRNEVERLFRRLKGFRRIFSRFEKLDVMYRAFLNVTLIVEMIKC